MRKYGRYCVNNRRSSIIIENNLQVMVMVMVMVMVLIFTVNFRHPNKLSTFQLFSLYQFQVIINNHNLYSLML